MKINLLTLSLILGSGYAMAQSTPQFGESVTTVNALGQTVLISQPDSFLKANPFGEWGEEEAAEIPLKDKREVRKGIDLEAFNAAVDKPVVQDPVVQTEMGTREMRAPIVNIAGQSGGSYPPDPSGAAGPDHYVQAVNTSVRCYTKTGSVIPGGTFSLSSLWPGSSNMGDPIVMYDRHADRWFISQFEDGPNRILIAISETPDPTGAYYSYSFTLSQFPDYPKYSIWWDGYYMSSNSSHTAVVFDRTKMLAGDPTAQMVALSLPSQNTGGFRMSLPSDADGPLPPNGTPCYFFNLEDDAFSGVAQDQIEIYEMTTDWVTPGNTTIVSTQQMSVPNFDSMFTGGWDNISQPGTTQKLDAIMGGLMYRAQHMRWTGYNTVMLSHAVDMGSNRSGIRWYELRDANDGVWSVFQSGTFAPADNTSRWMSSIAMDNWGNIGMGYSISNSTSIYPSLGYTGRIYGDVLGTMSYGEQIAFSGNSSQTVTERFGDYAHLSLDPDGETFWYTGEYISGGTPKTRIFSFSIRGEAGVDELNPYYSDLAMVAYQNGTDLIVNATGIYGEEKVELNIIAMNGQAVYSLKDVQPIDKTVQKNIDVSKLETGIYFVHIGNPNFQTVERILIKQ